MHILFDGIPLDQVTTSMTINAPAIVLLSLYVAVAQQRDIPLAKVGGTTQNDILKEFIAQKEWISPPRPAMKLVQDTMVFCAKHLPKWHPISISGYHIREAGADAVQEVAFTLADGIAYVKAAVDKGLDVDQFAGRLAFFFSVSNNFLEEVAKFRAARRMWAKIMKERFAAKSRSSLLLRFHTQTAGCTLTAQQPINNVMRVTLQALAAVLGGTQSLHTNSFDEALSLPTEEAVTVALRTQQVVAFESGVADTVDPLGGSHAVEAMTDHIEQEAAALIAKIDDLGGMLKAIESGVVKRMISDTSYRYQRSVESKDTVVVGVNRFQTQEAGPRKLLRVDPAVEARQVARLAEFKASRDPARVEQALAGVREAAVSGANLVPGILDAVVAAATLGEITGTLEGVFGRFSEIIEI
jgi:methylmalonyl-CoA mutase N-terminal domain/subunit